MKKIGEFFKGILTLTFLVWVVYSFTFGGCSGSEKNEEQKQWYQGGTLHASNIAEWKTATQENKLATCADIIANLWRNGKLNFTVKNIPDDFKPYAQELVNFIDTSTQDLSMGDAKNQTVSGLSAMGVIFMKWTK